MKYGIALTAFVSSLAWAQTYSPLFTSSSLWSAQILEPMHEPGLAQYHSPLIPADPRISWSSECSNYKFGSRSCTFDMTAEAKPWTFKHQHREEAPLQLLEFNADLDTRAHTAQRKIPVTAPQPLLRPGETWPRGVSRVRVRGSDGTIDYGSAVCVGNGRRPEEWIFLSCSHNFESGGTAELSVRGQWIEATVLYRDKLPEAVQTGPGQYTRVSAGLDRSVLVIRYPDQLLFRAVSLNRDIGHIALSGFPSTDEPVIICGQTQSHKTSLKAVLERPSQGGFSGGGVFNDRGQLVGIWTSGSKGTGYGHYLSEFTSIFRELGWVPDGWSEAPGTFQQTSLSWLRPPTS